MIPKISLKLGGASKRAVLIKMFRETDVSSVLVAQVPWLLTPAAKSEVLQGEANLQKTRELHNWQLGQIFGGNSAPFLILQVRRLEADYAANIAEGP